MASWPCCMIDSEVPMYSHKTEHLSRVREEMSMIFYSDVEEVKDIVDITKNGSKIFVLMRGLPGSGKSTLARYLIRTTVDTNTTKEKHVFSADDYFIDPKSNTYVFNRDLLREAHSWNVDGVMAAAQRNVSPIIVDNTNLTVSEMWPYVCIAAKQDYIVRYLEPSTHWRYNVHECTKRNLHGVSEKHVATMMGRFDRSVSASELFSLVSSQLNFQNDRISNSMRSTTRYSQHKHCAESLCRRQLHSICLHNYKISKRPCLHSGTCSPNLLKILLDPENMLDTVKTSRRPLVAHNLLLFKMGNIENYLGRTICFSIGNRNKEWNCKSFDENNSWCFNKEVVFSSLSNSSELNKFKFSTGIPSIQTTRNLCTPYQICKFTSFQNNVLASYDQIIKCLYFLYVFSYVRNVEICATKFISMNETYDYGLSVEKYNHLTTGDSQDRHRCISRDNVRMTLTLEYGAQPSVNINNVKKVSMPFNIRSSLLPAPRRNRGKKWSFEAYKQNEKTKSSHYSHTEISARVPPNAKFHNVEGRSTGQANSEDLKNAKSNSRLWDVPDSTKCDSWNACDNVNYNSWDTCADVTWETEPILHIIPNDSDCVPPKPPRTNRKSRVANYSSERNRLTIERESAILTTEVATNCSLPKPQRTNRRPRILEYSYEEYASMLEPKMTSLPPELETWNTVEDPLSSWKRKQNVESGDMTFGHGSHKPKNTSLVSGNINVRNHGATPSSVRKEEEQLISKPQREKRIRNR